MTTRMTIGQVLNQSLRWRSEPQQRRERDADRLLNRHHSAMRKIEKEQRRIEALFGRSTKNHDSNGVRRCADELAELYRRERVLRDIAPSIHTSANTFVFSSWMLRDSFRFCTESTDEAMHFVVGIDVDGLAVGTKIVPFEYVSRSIASAVGDHRATHRVYIDAHEAGHRILALIHSHPGYGPTANHHSSIDEATQRAWEETTKMISGIWSRDGYLRWFSCRSTFVVKVIGTQVRRIEQNVHQLVEETSLEM